jgi:hypothetical protein
MFGLIFNNFHNRNFECGQSVVVRDYRGNNKWTSGTIKQKTGPMSYRVETEAGSEWRRRADQILDSKLLKSIFKIVGEKIANYESIYGYIKTSNKIHNETLGLLCPLHSAFSLTHNSQLLVFRHLFGKEWANLTGLHIFRIKQVFRLGQCIICAL